MSTERVLYEERGGIARIVLNRPEALNAMDDALLLALEAALARAKDDRAVKAVVFTGAGTAFSAGADIRWLHAAAPLSVRELARTAVRVNEQIESLGKITVAALNGDAFGGGLELAEACVLRVADPAARLGHPEVRIGAIAGFGGTTRLARLVGKGRAAELLLTGRSITAPEALQIGLVQRVAAPGRALEQAEALAQEILLRAPIAVAMTWEALHRGTSLGADESARLGADYFGLVAATEDFREGTRAFIGKTAPAFAGR